MSVNIFGTESISSGCFFWLYDRWSLLEKHSCTASKLHLKPRRFKLFIEALVSQAAVYSFFLLQSYFYLSFCYGWLFLKQIAWQICRKTNFWRTAIRAGENDLVRERSICLRLQLLHFQVRHQKMMVIKLLTLKIPIEQKLQKCPWKEIWVQISTSAKGSCRLQGQWGKNEGQVIYILMSLRVN